MSILLDLLVEVLCNLSFDLRRSRSEELDRRYGPERHPVDLLDAWARREGVRLLDFRRAEIRDFRRWGRNPAQGLAYFRADVAFADGRRAGALVACGEPGAGLRSDRVEGVWEVDEAPRCDRLPAEDPLWDASLDAGPTA